MQIMVPLLCLMAVATVYGTWLYTPRDDYTAWYVIRRILWLSLSLCTGLFASAFVVTEIMANKVGAKDHNKGFALMANAAVAAYLAIITVELFPFIKEFLILALYSCYLYWVGLPKIMQLERKLRVIHGMLAVLITVLMHSLLFFLFYKIFYEGIS